MKKILKETRKYILYIIEELKSTRSSWRRYLIIERFFQHDRSNKKVITEMFIHITYVTITLEYHSDVSVERSLKLIKSEYKNIDEKMEGSRFSFEFE